MSNARLTAAALLLTAALISCDEQLALLDIVPQLTVAPMCYGLPATIYPGNPGSGTIVANGAGWTITGTARGDVIVGSPNDDVIDGLAGNDRVCAGDGNDELAGNAGIDQLDGEAGEDVVSYAASSVGVSVNLLTGRGANGDAASDRLSNIENITGSAFDDILRGNALVNELSGGAGNDVLYGADGADVISGDAGADQLRGEGDADVLNGGGDADQLIGGAGADQIDGGTETDRVNYIASSVGVTVDLTGTGAGGDAAGDTYANVEDIVGSNFADVLTGNSGPNVLDGRDGDDVINGGDGEDQLRGGNGADELHGNNHDDLLQGGEGADAVHGEGGEDALYGNNGDDDLNGNDGNDSVWPGLGSNTIDGGNGTDYLDSASCTDVYVSIETFKSDRCAAAADATTSLMDAAHAELTADGVSTTTITVQLRDANSNNLTLGGSTVVLTTDAGLLSNGGASATSVTAIDQGNGSYTATLTTSTSLDTATVSGTVDTNAMTANVQVGFVAGALHHFVVTGTDGNPIGQQSAGSAFNIKVVAQDAHNNTVTGFTGTVSLFATPGGNLGSSGSFVAGVLASQSVTIGTADNHTITATNGTESGTSNSFLVTSLPGAVADANGSNSSPGLKNHTALNTALEFVDEEDYLLFNDNRGFPAATVTHFGAVRCNNGDGTGTLAAATDAVTANDVGATATLNTKGGCTGGSLQVNANGTLTYTPATNYTGLFSFQYRIGNAAGTSDGTVTLAVGERPGATSGAYGGNVLGNVPINTAIGSGIRVDATGDRLTFNVTAESNGDATIAANKTYTFTPALGYSGAASFTFTAANGFGTTAGATVTMTVGTVVWFVDASAGAGGDGSRNSPVNCLVGTSCFDDVANEANDVIYVADGTYNSNGPLVLKDGQKLIAEGTNAAFSSAAGLTWTADMGDIPATGLTPPTLHTSTGNVITLGSGNTLRGLVLGNAQAGSAALGGSNFGTVSVDQTVSISTTATGLSLATGTIAGNLGGLTSSSTATSVSLTNVNGTSDFGTGALAGSFVVAGGAPNIEYAGSISNGSASPNVSVNGGTATLMLSGNISRTAGAGALLSVSGGHTTGTITLANGQITASSGTGLQFDNADGVYNLNGVGFGSALNGGDAGIDIVNGSSGTFTFGSNLAITSPSGSAFVANGSAPSVTYNGDITQATAGQRLIDITNQSAGAISFQSGTLTATNGTGLLFSNVDGTVSLNGTTTLNGGDAGVDVNNGTSGSIFIADGVGSASIGATTAPTGIAFDVDGSATTVTGAISYGGTLRQTNFANIARVQNVSGGSVTLSGNLTCNTSCTGLNVSGNTGGTMTFSGGTKAFTTGANAAVSLSRNNGATIAFTNGNLALTTTTGRGFDADSGGTLIVTGAGNTITTSGAATHALRIDSLVTAAASGISFASVNAGSATTTAGVHVYKLTGTNTLALGTVTVGGGVTGLNLSNNSATISATPTINAVTGTGVQLTSNAGAITLSAGAIGTTTSTTGNAVDINGGNATVTISGPITKTISGRLVNVTGRSGGTIDIPGVVSCTSSCTGLNVISNTGGTVQFTNASKTFNTGTNTAINFSSNTGNTTLAFTNGGLAVTTTTGNGIVASNSAIANATLKVQGGSNTISSTTGIALSVIQTTIGAAAGVGEGGLNFQSINSTTTGSNVTVNLDNTGSGSFRVNGTGSTFTSGGTISNKTADAIRMNTVGGAVTLKNMDLLDLSSSGDASSANNTRSLVDAIEAVGMGGGLTLENMRIQRVSDDGIMGAQFSGSTPGATTFVGLTITNCLFEDTNRFGVSARGDAQNEGAVYINGISGTVSVTGTTFRRVGAGLDLNTATSGSLDLTVQSSSFLNVNKETGGTGRVGNWGLNVVQNGSLSSVVRVGDPNETNAALGNAFTENALASIRVIRNSGSTGSLQTVISRNTFTVTDHSSPGFAAGATAYNFPQGGVLLRSMSGGSYEAAFTFNTFNQAMHADGGLGNLSLIHEAGTAEFIVKNNSFNLPWDAPVELRSDGQLGGSPSALVLFSGNTYGDGIVGDGTTDLGGQSPYTPFYLQVRNGGRMEATFQNENPFGLNDTSSGFSQSFHAQTTVASDFLSLFLQNTQSPRGYALKASSGSTYNLYRNGSGAATAAGVLAANNVFGGGGVDTTNPPTVVNSGAGTITLSSTAPQRPSISIGGRGY